MFYSFIISLWLSLRELESKWEGMIIKVVTDSCERLIIRYNCSWANNGIVSVNTLRLLSGF